MKIKHSQVRAMIKFIGIVIFGYSLYQKLKQIFIYGGTVANLPADASNSDVPEPIKETQKSYALTTTRPVNDEDAYAYADEDDDE